MKKSALKRNIKTKKKLTLWKFIKISHAIEIRGFSVAQKWCDGPNVPNNKAAPLFL